VSDDVIALTPKEMMRGAMVGVIRQIESLQHGFVDRAGAGLDEGWQLHVEGALGELAFAKWRGIFWTGAGSIKAPDVGGYGVRTRSNHGYELIIRDDDDDDRRFVLLTGRNGTYKVHGWIHAKDAKQERWRQTHGGRSPAYFVPQSALYWWPEDWDGGL